MRISSPAVGILLAFLPLVLCGCGASAGNSVFTELSAQTVVLDADEGRILSPVAGTVVALPAKFAREAGLGKHLAISTTVTYPFAGKQETAQFITVIGNLSRVKVKKGTVAAGDDIGTAQNGKAFVIVMADSLNSYLVCSATKRAENRFDKWWFNGEFLLDDSDNLWLGYLPETSPAAALAQMLAGGKTNRYLLHLTLDSHPEPVPAETAFELTAYGENRTGLEEIESMQTFVDGEKTAVIFWPAGFAQFLREEYVPGNPIWIFSRLIPSDTDYRKVYIFAREFLPEPIEALYESRLGSYQQ